MSETKDLQKVTPERHTQAQAHGFKRLFLVSAESNKQLKKDLKRLEGENKTLRSQLDKFKKRINDLEGAW